MYNINFVKYLLYTENDIKLLQICEIEIIIFFTSEIPSPIVSWCKVEVSRLYFNIIGKMHHWPKKSLVGGFPFIRLISLVSFNSLLAYWLWNTLFTHSYKIMVYINNQEYLPRLVKFSNFKTYQKWMHYLEPMILLWCLFAGFHKSPGVHNRDTEYHTTPSTYRHDDEPTNCT